MNWIRDFLRPNFIKIGLTIALFALFRVSEFILTSVRSTPLQYLEFLPVIKAFGQLFWYPLVFVQILLAYVDFKIIGPIWGFAYPFLKILFPFVESYLFISCAIFLSRIIKKGIREEGVGPLFIWSFLGFVWAILSLVGAATAWLGLFFRFHFGNFVTFLFIILLFILVPMYGVYKKFGSFKLVIYTLSAPFFSALLLWFIIDAFRHASFLW